MTTSAKPWLGASTLMESADQAVPRSNTPPQPDRELWRRAAAGDETAFAELFERHVQAVWNHAYRLTGSWSLAEDLASSTFLTAWRKRNELTLTGDSALPWLFTVASNLARSEFRRSKRFQLVLRRVEIVATERDHADTVAARIDDDQRLRTVLAAVRQLPKAERTAVEMCLLGGVSTADAAAALGISPVSVRAQISRARKRLRTLLREPAPESAREPAQQESAPPDSPLRDSPPRDSS